MKNEVILSEATQTFHGFDFGLAFLKKLVLVHQSL